MPDLVFHDTDQVLHGDDVVVVVSTPPAYLSVRGITNPGTVEQAYEKGDIISVYDHPIDGTGYVVPDWIKVTITDASADEVIQYLDSWVLELGYEILQTDLTLDRALIRSFTEEPGASNLYAITWTDIQPFVEEWNGSFVSEPAVNDVRFSVEVFGLYTSAGLWGADPASQGIIITETDYVEATGVHTTLIDISASPFGPDEVRARINAIGAQIISTDPVAETAIVEFYRDEVVPRFLAALQSYSFEGIRRRKYKIDEATVDNGIAAGGDIETDKATFETKLIDKSAL